MAFDPADEPGGYCPTCHKHVGPDHDYDYCADPNGGDGDDD